MNSRILNTLLSNTEIRLLFDLQCDFRTIQNSEADCWIDSETAENINFIGHDASGSYYGLLSNGNVVYIISSAMAGVMAESLEKAVSLLIAFSGVGYWLYILQEKRQMIQ